MDKAWQLVPLFTTGFLISRMVARTGLAERALRWMIERSGGAFGHILLILLMATICLSMFIPNMLTVLALLPIVEALAKRLEEVRAEAQVLVTPLILSLIYGANIGGMGSLVGSPANAMMLVFLELSHIPGREQINFLSWLTWGVPLVLGFGLLSWMLLVAFLVPRKLFSLRLDLPKEEEQAPQMRQHRDIATRLALGTGAFWLVLSVLTALLPDNKILWDGMAVLFGVGFVVYTFGVRIGDGPPRPLLRVEDCYTGLPWRGVGLAVGAVLFSVLLFQLGVPGFLATQLKAHLPTHLPPFWFYALLVLITIFTTELISNTAASAAFFPIAYQIAIKLGLHPLPAIMGVALASTCAFMSPLATPATGLAFGGMKGVSLRKMLWLGALVNLIGGLWLALLLTYVLPWFYGISLQLPMP